MADIFHQFPIKASAEQVYEAVSTPAGLNAWWTKEAAGKGAPGEEYSLWFGPEYDWRAIVRQAEPGAVFELEMTRAMEDWMGSRVRFELSEADRICTVSFSHTGWPEVSPHFRISSYCWATYLRLLKRYVERGEIVPYEGRDEA